MADAYIGNRPFYGRTVPELEAMLRSAQDELAGFVTSTSADSTSVQRQQTLSVQSRIRLLRKELSLLAPDKWPADAPLKRTTPQFL